MPNIHDTGYKRLFSDKRIFRQLLETFVDLDWVKDIDFDSCELLDKSFVSDHYKETESDIIYKVKLREQDLYIIILLEFQSTIDRFMSLRFLNYISNFLMDFVQSAKQKPRSLPAVFPLLLYNGDKKWTAPQALDQLIDGNELLGNYGIRFQYFKIAENEFSKEKLLKISNLISTLFLAEAYYDPKELEERLISLFEKEEDKRGISLLLNWFFNLREHGRISPGDYDKLERVYKDKEEVKEMLITALKKEKQAIYEEGKQDGIQEGLQEGLHAKSVKVAERMLRKGQDIDFICEITELSRDEVLQIKKRLDGEA